jgi:hypothetical protein
MSFPEHQALCEVQPGDGIGAPVPEDHGTGGPTHPGIQSPCRVKTVVLFEAYYLSGTIVKACRQQGFHFGSTLTSHRRLYEQGWKLKVGRYSKNLFRRHRTATLVWVKRN